MIDEDIDMKSYRRDDNSKHDYTIRYLTPATIGGTNKVEMEKTTLTLDDIVLHYLIGINKEDHVSEIVDISIDGKALPKTDIDKWNKRLAGKIDECDGGGAGAGGAGAGDAGGAIGGDAGAASVGEPVGTTNAEVLGNCDHCHDGYLCPGCFHAPSKVKVPLYRWQVANGGSKRKKDKKGKDKHYAYEKGMKVVVNMFEDEKGTEEPKINKGKVLSRLRSISKGVKSMDDVKAVEAQVERDKSKIESKLAGSKYAQIKEIFLDLYGFIKDICTGKYKASWFAITMVAVGLIYLLSPIDLIPDAIPVIGIIDDAFVLKLIYDAIKDELDRWKAQKSGVAIAESDGKKWVYFEELTNGDDGPESYDYKSYIKIPELKEKVKTKLDGNEIWYDEIEDEESSYWSNDDIVTSGGFAKEFNSKDAAVKYALDRIDDQCLAYQNDTRIYASEEDWAEERERVEGENEDAKSAIQNTGMASISDGRYTIWQCQIVEV